MEGSCCALESVPVTATASKTPAHPNSSVHHVNKDDLDFGPSDKDHKNYIYLDHFKI